MKKYFLIIMVLFLLISFSSQLNAQRHDGFDFYLNFGILTDDSLSFDPFYWYSGVNFDFHVGDLIMISPEANVVTYKFNFSTFLLEPAIVINFKLGSMFLGGGLGKLFLLGGDEVGSSDIFLKLNGGFSNGDFRFKVFIDTPFNNLFKKGMLVGVQLGIGF